MNNDDQKIVLKKSKVAADDTTSKADVSADTTGTDNVNVPSTSSKSITDTSPQKSDSHGDQDSPLQEKSDVWKKPTKKYKLHPADVSLLAVTDFVSKEDISDMAQRVGDKTLVQSGGQDTKIANVRADIEKALQGDVTSKDTATGISNVVSLKKEISKDVVSAAGIAMAIDTSTFSIKDEIDKILKQQSAVETPTQDISTPEIPTESVADTSSSIEDLKASIQFDLNTVPAETVNKNKGIAQTYYGDVSGAMGSNKPATMAELLRKARFEKKEKAILSPKSKKNMVYIVGSILLIALSIFLLFKVFSSKKGVEYITEKRVDSLVFSNLDTGINITDIGVEKTKQAIRKVVETELDEGSLNQIYYVAQDEHKNLRRLDIKQVFDATEHTPPQLLYENVEGEFMHGVYKTDENHPFMILKTLSYDKVFEGMKEWEPRMIDDLATYFDLSDEATDRSLVQDGFSDDIINNKNVRVARFIPREADRSLIERIGDKIIQTSVRLFDVAYAQTGYKVFGTVTDSKTFMPLSYTEVYVRDLGISTETNALGMYVLDLPIVGVHQLEYRHDGYNLKNFDVDGEFNLNVALTPFKAPNPVSGKLDTAGSNGNNFDGYVCYRSTKKCFDGNGDDISSDFKWRADVSCYDELHNGANDEQLDGSYYGQDGYSCFKVLGTKDYLSGEVFISPLNTNDICFHAITGQKLNTTDESRADYFPPWHPLAVCFASYECHRFACFDRFNNVVGLAEQGKPGITCGETLERVYADYEGRKVCREYTDLRMLENISQSKLCFDEDGKFIQTGTDGNLNNSPGNNMNCITPTNRNQRLCLNHQDQVVVPQFGMPLPGIPGSPYKICFDALEDSAGVFIDDQFVTLNSRLRELAASLGRRFEILAATAKLTGMSSEHIESLENSSDFFYDIAYMNVLENETIEQALVIVKDLETILNILDPSGTLQQPGPDGSLNLFGKLSFAIDVIKDAFGFSHNIAWATIGSNLPVGIEIFAGETIAAVGAIQEALVAIGLMNPLSITGTLDLVTQGAITDLQVLNNLEPTGIVDTETLELITGMIEGHEMLYGEGTIATIDDYFDEVAPLSGFDDLVGEGTIGIGSYSVDVQSLQIILYSEGYDIDAINGVFDPQTCEALMQYQEFNHLVLANHDGGCTLSIETIESLNTLIREGNYLGAGFMVNGAGFLEGTGKISGMVGPGVISFARDAEAASLREGDIVLMYTFLDEQTILITRHASVITEIIKRRALDDIFNKS